MKSGSWVSHGKRCVSDRRRGASRVEPVLFELADLHMADKKLSIEFPTFGWTQILTRRAEILSAFDAAREKSKLRKVQTSHGIAVEAHVRDWLTEFLPKRYGVTSGFIVSVGIKDGAKAPHFDVIIYNQLDAPVLWVENHPDTSVQGASRAIPVEHVLAVIEVKSSFSKRTVVDAIKHLGELKPLLDATDSPDERYPLHLPASFVCCPLFLELRKTDAYDAAAAEALLDGDSLRGFMGALILRGEGHTDSSSAYVHITSGDTPIPTSIERPTRSLLDQSFMGPPRQSGQKYLGTMAMWAESNFAQFAFDLLAVLNGKFDRGRVSSFYGLGMR